LSLLNTPLYKYFNFIIVLFLTILPLRIVVDTFPQSAARTQVVADYLKYVEEQSPIHFVLSKPTVH